MQENTDTKYRKFIEMKSVSEFGAWLNSAVDKRSFAGNIAFKFTVFLASVLEHATGKKLYVEAAAIDRWKNVAPGIKRLYADLAAAGFIKNLRFQNTFPDDPRAIITNA